MSNTTHTLTRDGLIDGLAGLLRTPTRQPERVRVVCTEYSTSFGIPSTRYGVSVDGEIYECSERDLALLKTGMSPTDLELPVWSDDDEDDGSAWDRAASAGDRAYQLRKEQF